MGSGVGMGFCEKFLGPLGEIKTDASLTVWYIIEVCTAAYSSLIKNQQTNFGRATHSKSQPWTPSLQIVKHKKEKIESREETVHSKYGFGRYSRITTSLCVKFLFVWVSKALTLKQWIDPMGCEKKTLKVAMRHFLNCFYIRAHQRTCQSSLMCDILKVLSY